YVGHSWKKTETAYGPIYTLLSYPFALLGVTGAVWGMKALAMIASALTLLLTWRCAVARGRNPVAALVLVGAHPLYVTYAVGGAHNDLLMMALMMAAVALTFAGRDAPAAATVVVGALVKATVAALLPFMILAKRSRGQILGALGALAAGVLLAFAVFGIDG